MANNFVSYNRFTALPANIANFGATVEEFKSQRGAPDKDPVASPMASPAVSETQLALAPSGSDRLRLGSPIEPEANPFEGPAPTLVSSRKFLSKVDGQVIADLQHMIDAGQVADPNTRNLMADSLRRVFALRDRVAHNVAMRESITANMLATSKG